MGQPLFQPHSLTPVGSEAIHETLFELEGHRMPVEIVGSDSLPHRYVFLLSRQNLPSCAGCWMADAVLNADDEADPDARPEYGA